MAHNGHIVIPTTHEQADNVVSAVKESMVTEFGGYSAYEGSGGWHRSDGLVTEPHVRLIATCSVDDMSRDRFEQWFRFEAQYVNDMLEQEAVLVEFRDVDMELI
jgi:hypothetical protein